MMSKTFEEFYSELYSMNIQDMNNALVEASRNLEKCTEPFTAQDIIRQQQETINRQKAEIERLQTENRILSQKRMNLFERLEFIHKARAEAIKEFAERLKDSLCKSIGPSRKLYWKISADIDNLVKEMVGEG